jgi:hypothetical protein
MTHNDWDHVFAVVVIVCVTILFFIDAGTELGVKLAVRLHWTLGWYTLRVLAAGCAIALALDILF